MIVSQQSPGWSLLAVGERVGKRGQFTCDVMGVLVDVTRSIYRERDKDYVTELKVIDETLNQERLLGVMIRYCSVYIFSREDMTAAFCNQVGHLICLQKFTFSLWHSIKLQTKYLSRSESLFCFQAAPQSLHQVGALPSKKIFPLTPSFTQKGLALYAWFNDYFLYRYTPPLGIPLINNFSVLAEPFQLILRLLSGEEGSGDGEMKKGEGEMEGVLRFEDGQGNKEYFMKRSSVKGLRLPEKEYVLIRGVKCIGSFYEIRLTETGNLLGLPDGRGEEYKKLMNYCPVHRFNERYLARSHKVCHLSRMTHLAEKRTPICDLMKSVDLYEGYNSKVERGLEECYMIEATVINFKGNLHMFHTEHQIIINREFIAGLSEDERRELVQEKKISYLYEGTLGVIDRSCESSGRIFSVHLFSNEPRTYFYEQELIDQLVQKASTDYKRQVQFKVKSIIEGRLQSLVEKSSFSNSVSMLVQPIKAEALVFRLTNTVFEQ